MFHNVFNSAAIVPHMQGLSHEARLLVFDAPTTNYVQMNHFEALTAYSYLNLLESLQ